LHDEISLLGDLLGQTIREIAGHECFEIVESFRQLAREHRQGDAGAADALAGRIAGLGIEPLRVVVRAFGIFLDLVNLVEDRQRLRVVRQRQRASYPRAYGESVQEAVERLQAAGVNAAAMQQLLDGLRLDLVLTAHPTEAKRRSIRARLRRIRGQLDELDRDLTPSERSAVHRRLQVELTKLWQTDFIRPWRPSVLQEVERGLSIQPVLWDVVPEILAELRTALVQVYGATRPRVAQCLRFGSWIGGDRDGHPHVTAAITEQTFVWLRHTALDTHLAHCCQLIESLSLSRRQAPVSQELDDALDNAVQRWPVLADTVADLSPAEAYRRWLRVIHWRLGQTRRVSLDQPDVEGAYRAASELDADVLLMCRSLVGAHNELVITEELVPWLDRIRAFGFHLASLDVRQDARQYAQVVNELLAKSGREADAARLSEWRRQELLVHLLEQPIDVPAGELSELARDTLMLFRLLQRVLRVFGAEAVGGHVVSMTHAASDILSVLWLWRGTAAADPARGRPPRLFLPIIPLFETITDLREAPQTMRQILDHPAYQRYLQAHGNQQTVMIGYSDSTKDGGYLAACWETFRVQERLYELAAQRGIALRFFHGRGGSLGRGGGPAARSILSLPAKTFTGALRLTEQGEVLADRYDNPRTAHRHLEQIVWSALLAAGRTPASSLPRWRTLLDTLSESSLRAYRALVTHPQFVDFFRRMTPLDEIEQLPIGSRPTRRGNDAGLASLRAIPWVFSWTQCRCLIPAWFGLGTAVTELLGSVPEESAALRTMYEQWPFFRATIDNAALALAKTDLAIARRYAELAEPGEARAALVELIGAEFDRARAAVCRITGHAELLDDIPWLKASIQYRNRYIDPLNLIQVEVLRRLRRVDAGQDPADVDELRHLARLTIQGLAAGMRTTG
jgi:phosphoenolpyruvate carboxylase